MLYTIPTAADTETSIHLLPTTNVSKLDSDHPMSSLAALYKSLEGQTGSVYTLERKLVSVINAILTRKRVIFSLSERMFISLCRGDTNLYSPGAHSRDYKKVTDLLLGGVDCLGNKRPAMIALSKQGNKKQRKTDTFRVVSQELLSVLEALGADLNAQLIQESQFMSNVNGDTVEAAVEAAVEAVMDSPTTSNSICNSSGSSSVSSPIDNQILEKQESISSVLNVEPEDKAKQIEKCKELITRLQQYTKLSQWEKEFLESTSKRLTYSKLPTSKQEAVLEAIAVKATPKTMLNEKTARELIKQHTGNVTLLAAEIQKYDYAKAKDKLSSLIQSYPAFSRDDRSKLGSLLNINPPSSRNTNTAISSHSEYSE